MAICDVLIINELLFFFRRLAVGDRAGNVSQGSRMMRKRDEVKEFWIAAVDFN